MPVSSRADGTNLDLRGLRCPLPVLHTRKLLAAMVPGARATIIADDPLAAIDIPHFLRESGDHLESRDAVGAAIAFVIRRAVPGEPGSTCNGEGA